MDGGHRASGAEVRDHQPQVLDRPIQELRGTTDRPCHGQAVEAEATDAEALDPVVGERIAPCLLRQCRVEGSVEAGDVRQLRECRAAGTHDGRRATVVERR